MYARVVTRKFHTDKTAKAIQVWKEEVVPLLKRQKGFKSCYLAGDPQTGNGMAVTFWENEADAKAMNTNGVSEQLNAILGEYYASGLVRDYYEVYVQA